jgi:hypothetical protein
MITINLKRLTNVVTTYMSTMNLLSKGLTNVHAHNEPETIKMMSIIHVK